MQQTTEKNQRTLAVRPLSDAIGTFLLSMGGKDREQINALWDNWNDVMGPEISSMGFPLGHKEDILLLGAEDNMAMQELSMLSSEIVGRANAFMDRNFFSSSRVHLLQENKPLNRKRTIFQPQPKIIPPPPKNFGNLRGKLDPESPITRCYEAFVNLYFPE